MSKEDKLLAEINLWKSQDITRYLLEQLTEQQTSLENMVMNPNIGDKTAEQYMAHKQYLLGKLNIINWILNDNFIEVEDE